MAVSDDSLKDSVGVAVFVLQSPHDSTELQGVLCTPGPISTGNSYKCELSGLFAIVYLSQILCTTYDITQDSILVVCDTQTALKKFSHGSS